MPEIAGEASIVVGEGGKVSYKETFVRETSDGGVGLPNLWESKGSELDAPLCCNGSGNYIVRNVFEYKKTGEVVVHSPQSKERWVMRGKNIVKLVVMLVALTVVVGAVLVATGHGFPVIAGVVAGVAHLCAGTSMACITAKVASCVFAGVGSLIALFAMLRLEETVQSMPKDASNFEPVHFTGYRGGVGSGSSTGVEALKVRPRARAKTNPRPTGGQMALGGKIGDEQAVQAHLDAAARFIGKKL